METMASTMYPALTPSAGGLPNPSSTLFPSSSTSSGIAVKVKLFSVSPALNVTLAGTPL